MRSLSPLAVARKQTRESRPLPRDRMKSSSSGLSSIRNPPPPIAMICFMRSSYLLANDASVLADLQLAPLTVHQHLDFVDGRAVADLLALGLQQRHPGQRG